MFNDRNSFNQYREKALAEVTRYCLQRKSIVEHNHKKVIQAFQDLRVSQECFSGSTGYGYGDHGRDLLDRVFAHVFHAEDALVRSQLVSGTHTLAVSLFGLLRPGDRLVSFMGAPYDTLRDVIGIGNSDRGSLQEFGILYTEMSMKQTWEDRVEQLPEDTKVVLMQRSRGYDWRRSLNMTDLASIIRRIKAKFPHVVILVDNCYGEFVEEREPSEVGADVVVGSLIKNPGGGLAPTGGYIVGKKHYIEQISYRLTSPGIGREVGSTDGTLSRLMYQGLYMAPHVVEEALKGAVYAASLFQQQGYLVSPALDEDRTDIVQAIRFGGQEEMIAFCQAIQHYSPVDSFVVPEPWDMPGYTNQVIMAAGTFIGGATSELSCDAPLREPYALYLQGGLSFEYSRLAIDAAFQSVIKANLS